MKKILKIIWKINCFIGGIIISYCVIASLLYIALFLLYAAWAMLILMLISIV